MIYRTLPSYPLSERGDCSPESLNASSANAPFFLVDAFIATTSYTSHCAFCSADGTLFRYLGCLRVGCLVILYFVSSDAVDWCYKIFWQNPLYREDEFLRIRFDEFSQNFIICIYFSRSLLFSSWSKDQNWFYVRNTEEEHDCERE